MMGGLGFCFGLHDFGFHQLDLLFEFGYLCRAFHHQPDFSGK